MDSPCDHVGCHLQAVWVCLYRDRTVTEPHLCDLPWSVLWLRDAERARGYAALRAETPQLRREVVAAAS